MRLSRFFSREYTIFGTKRLMPWNLRVLIQLISLPIAYSIIYLFINNVECYVSHTFLSMIQYNWHIKRSSESNRTKTNIDTMKSVSLVVVNRHRGVLRGIDNNHLMSKHNTKLMLQYLYTKTCCPTLQLMISTWQFELPALVFPWELHDGN